jgi:hypothetical protein
LIGVHFGRFFTNASGHSGLSAHYLIFHVVDDGVLHLENFWDVLGIDSGQIVLAAVVGLQEVKVEPGDNVMILKYFLPLLGAIFWRFFFKFDTWSALSSIRRQR